ncbi:MAG: ABC transporter permease [Nostoc sp.]|uniref:ABC transporter permease n=1 Tax=Nostoc sp. TaxID=1180 RepID=UPI002FF8F5FF
MMHWIDRILSSRFWALFQKECTQILHNRALVIQLLLPPTLFLILFGVALDPDVKGLKVGITDYSHSRASREFTEIFSQTDAFTVSKHYADQQDMTADLAKGALTVGIVIPPEFADDIARRRTADVQALFDAINANTATTASTYVSQLVNDYNQRRSQVNAYSQEVASASNATNNTTTSTDYPSSQLTIGSSPLTDNTTNQNLEPSISTSSNQNNSSTQTSSSNAINQTSNTPTNSSTSQSSSNAINQTSNTPTNNSTSQSSPNAINQTSSTLTNNSTSQSSSNAINQTSNTLTNNSTTSNANQSNISSDSSSSSTIDQSVSSATNNSDQQNSNTSTNSANQQNTSSPSIDTPSSQSLQRNQVEMQTEVLYNPGLDTAWFIVPGIIGILMTVLGSQTAASLVVREKEAGTIEQLVMTPASSTQIILAKIIPLLILLTFDLLVGLAVGRLIFGMPFRGNLLLLLIISILYFTVGISIGILVASYAKSQQQCQLITFFINPPLSLLSGATSPIASMNSFMQSLTYLNPMRYFIEVCRAIILKGVGLEVLWTQVLILIAFAAILLTLSVRQFSRQLA